MIKSLVVPSGRTFSQSDHSLLKKMAHYGFIRYSAEPFTLKSGIQSHVYVFGREDLTEHPGLQWDVGVRIRQHLDQSVIGEQRSLMLIGIPMAGLALAAATSLMSYYNGGTAIGYRTMRPVKKGHGAHQTWIDGQPDVKQHAYWLIDNVATDGKTKIDANERAAEDGYPERLPCLIFVDRQQGAVERLLKAGFPQVEVVFNLLDITYAFGEMNLWPKATVKLVEEEIAAHRALPSA